jgi:hypothetical protein
MAAMPQLETEKLNKEKALFLLLAAIASVGLYLFLASAPVTLATGKSIGAQSSPAPHENAKLEDQADIDYYLKGDARRRKTPFTPTEWHPRAPVIANPGERPPPPPPPPPEEVVKPKAAPTFDPKMQNIQVAFGGVIMRPDEAPVALLRSKVDDSMLCKKEGDVFSVGGEKYKITNIEKQAIWLVDKDGTPFILNDSGADDVVSATDKQPAEKGDKPKPKTKDATAQKAAAPEKPQKPKTPAPPRRAKKDTGE